MPTKKNFIKKSDAPRSIFPDATALIGATTTFNQGDFMVLDTSNHVIAAVSGTGELGTNFLGMATCSVSLGKLISPIQGTDTDAAAGSPAMSGPVHGVTVLATLKTGDALVAGGKVYLDAGTGTRNVTSTSGSSVAIGIYQGPAISSAAAGQQIEILIGAQYKV